MSFYIYTGALEEKTSIWKMVDVDVFLGLTHQCHDLLAFFSEAPTPRVGTLFFSQNYPNVIVLDCVLGFV